MNIQDCVYESKTVLQMKDGEVIEASLKIARLGEVYITRPHKNDPEYDCLIIYDYWGALFVAENSAPKYVTGKPRFAADEYLEMVRGEYRVNPMIIAICEKAWKDTSFLREKLQKQIELEAEQNLAVLEEQQRKADELAAKEAAALAVLESKAVDALTALKNGEMVQLRLVIHLIAKMGVIVPKQTKGVINKLDWDLSRIGKSNASVRYNGKSISLEGLWKVVEEITEKEL